MRVAARPPQGVVEREFDLAVRAPKLIAGPMLEGSEDLGIDSKEEVFSVGRCRHVASELCGTGLIVGPATWMISVKYR